jgi:hypothetical protein
MTGEWEIALRYGAWEGRVRRHDVRAFNTTVWAWEFGHDAAGTFDSGIRRTREEAVESIRGVFRRYGGVGASPAS